MYPHQISQGTHLPFPTGFTETLISLAFGHDISQKKMPEMDRNAGDIPFSGIPETNISHGVKIHIPHGYFINHKPQLGMVILLGYPRRITRFFDGILPYFYRHQSSMFIPITTRQPPRHSRRTVTAVAN